MHKELTNKQIREQREFETLFKNPKHARAMWSQNVIDRYSAPVLRPIVITDKDGNPTPQSQLEQQIWDQLKQEFESKGQDRLPTEGELMEACQAYYARHNAAAYVAKRDSMGAKPIDESKQTITQNNPLEGLTDEELEVMAKALDDLHQAQSAQEQKKDEN